MNEDDSLNRAIAEKIFGHVPCGQWSILRASPLMYSKNDTCDHDCCYPQDLPVDYEGSYEATHGLIETVLQKASKRFWLAEMLHEISSSLYYGEKERRVSYHRISFRFFEYDHASQPSIKEHFVSFKNQSYNLAVCRAALAAHKRGWLGD